MRAASILAVIASAFLGAAPFGAVLFSGCLSKAEPIDPSPACVAVLECYFGDTPLSAVPGFKGLFPEGSDIVRETYGAGGTCWLEGAGALADSCTDRCKGLLWQDCARTYRRECADVGGACLVDEDCKEGADDEAFGPCDPVETEDVEGVAVGVPFCADACNVDNALRCRFEDFAIQQGGRQEDEPLFSACPAGTRCNAVPPEFAGPDTAPDTTGATGCCENEQRDLLVDDRETCNE